MTTSTALNQRKFTLIKQDDSSSETEIIDFTKNITAPPSLIQPAPNTKQHKKLVEQNFIETIPLDARFQVLNFVVSNRHPIVAHNDLVSYAQTCKTALADIESYHAACDDPQQSLLASRTLVQKAWNRAASNSFFNRADTFQKELNKLAFSLRAIYLDVRTQDFFMSELLFDARRTLPTNPERLGPESIVAVMRADKPEFIHLKLGFNKLRVHEIIEVQYFKKCLSTLMIELKERQKRGIKLPDFFLEVSGIVLSKFMDYVENADRKTKLGSSFKVSGLSLTGIAANRFFEYESKKQCIEVEGFYDVSADAWSSCFKKLSHLTYLHIEGWPSDAMAGGLIAWLKEYHQLEELHLSNCGLDNNSVRSLCRVLKHSSQLKCLALDGYQFFDHKVEAKLANLLENNPALKIIFGKQITPDSPLESYRQDNRVICNRYHEEMRVLPEIYGETNFFGSGIH